MSTVEKLETFILSGSGHPIQVAKDIDPRKKRGLVLRQGTSYLLIDGDVWPRLIEAGNRLLGDAPALGELAAFPTEKQGHPTWTSR